MLSFCSLRIGAVYIQPHSLLWLLVHSTKRKYYQWYSGVFEIVVVQNEVSFLFFKNKQKYSIKEHCIWNKDTSDDDTKRLDNRNKSLSDPHQLGCKCPG